MTPIPISFRTLREIRNENFLRIGGFPDQILDPRVKPEDDREGGVLFGLSVVQ